VKFLHTSDWHIGKSLKGHSRLEEQELVLRELVAMARGHDVDAVLIAGDLYETPAPSADAQEKVVKALLGFASTGAEVIAIAGNHDHASTFEAYRPLMKAAKIHFVGQPRTGSDGGLVHFVARGTGEAVNVAVLPFLAQRYAGKAAEIVTGTAADATARYDEMIRKILTGLSEGFTSEAINVVMAHLTVTGGKMGGGEREAQSIFEYHVPATVFPANAHYVALGHLHRRQHLPAACPVHYCGSPINVDFGEEDNASVALLVEVAPSIPAHVTELPIKAALRLRTVHGTVTKLAEHADSFGNDLLRVIVDEPTRAGLREDVQAALPNALEILIAPEFQTTVTNHAASDAGLDRSPGDLFDSYLAEKNIVDPRIPALFNALHDALTDGGDTDLTDLAVTLPALEPESNDEVVAEDDIDAALEPPL
jgi:DNA repair protein SbcD/Mre11